MIRQAIAERESGRSDNSVRLIPELAVCRSDARIDLAVVGRQFVGWEIKTASDSLYRLGRQAESYGRVFDRVWLAADRRHLEAAEKIIPSWWGIARVESSGPYFRVVAVRASKVNRNVDPYSLVTLLWRDEVAEELASIGLGNRIGRRPKRELWEELAQSAPATISLRELRTRVRGRLMDRTHWRADGQQN